MPELPEVEVLVRHLKPLLSGRKIRRIQVHRLRVIRPSSIRTLSRTLKGARFVQLSRRGKFLLFRLHRPGQKLPVNLLGHLGMTGRMYLLPKTATLPRHTAVSMDLGDKQFVFEDTRYFGRMTLDLSPFKQLGPEPLSSEFTSEQFFEKLSRSKQPIKVKLLDQKVVAGLGNIYASEALFRSRISPRLAGKRLTDQQVSALWKAIRDVLSEAISRGSTIPLNFDGGEKRDRLFYYGSSPEQNSGQDEEHFFVYSRSGQPCLVCGSIIQRLVQAARSTFYCRNCQCIRR